MRNRYKRRKSLEDLFWSKVEKRGPDDCWLWMATRDKRGYGRFPRGKEVLAHRRAYILENGDIPASLIVRHTCDNPRCVNPAHLLIGTMKDNTADMFDRNRDRHIAQGENHWRSRLTDKMVMDIRAAQAAGRSIVSISRSMGLEHGLVYSALVGWKHIE